MVSPTRQPLPRPMIQEVQPDPSADDIAKEVAAAIVAHKLPPGTRLREEALARVYKVSRTKIRAALLMLSKDKLINIIPDKGAFVSKPDANEAREVYAVRRILEAALAREFVACAQDADYRRIDAHLAEERRAVESGDVQARNHLLSHFHILLAEAVGNSVLTGMLRELSARSAVITVLFQSSHDASCSSREHHAFIEAARAGDVERACALMDEHLEHVLAALDFAGDRQPGSDLVAALLS
ncbi:DNA-binding transcriptional regulator, GntR family [Achromobacter sp. NFACC18-2]|nr:DNA-binding transcriptional regulator, GntR family [Achromobacter sp. NFACC18-2]